jgi:hypothetical protein
VAPTPATIEDVFIDRMGAPEDAPTPGSAWVTPHDATAA